MAQGLTGTMRILLLTQWWDPEPFYKGIPFAKELQRLGHEVEVLTGFPNYPGGKLYDGYRVRLWQRENMEGVEIIRVPLYPSHDRSAMGRVLNYLSFAVSASILGPFLTKPADIIYVYHPPATVGLPAIILGFLKRAPFVYDIQDLWPDTLASTGMLDTPWILKMISAWCKIVYKAAGQLAVLSEGFKKRLIERGVPDEKVEVIYNWSDERQLNGNGKPLSGEVDTEGRFTVVFAGTMGKAQALDSVIEAASILARRCPEALFIFIGGGIEVDRLKALAAKRAPDNVQFLPRRPLTEIGSALASADALLVHLRDDPLFEITIPSKTQSYLAFGRPVVMAVKGDAASIIERAKSGITCAPEDPEALADAVERLITMPREEQEKMGRSGRAFHESEMSFKKGLGHFNEIFIRTQKNKG